MSKRKGSPKATATIEELAAIPFKAMKSSKVRKEVGDAVKWAKDAETERKHAVLAVALVGHTREKLIEATAKLLDGPDGLRVCSAAVESFHSIAVRHHAFAEIFDAAHVRLLVAMAATTPPPDVRTLDIATNHKQPTG